MSNQVQYVTTAVATAAGVVGGAYCAYKAYQKYQQTKIPMKWTQVGTLSDIYVYPIKSCAPVIADRAECTFLGLKDGWLRDRVLMIVDKNMNFITARAYPELLTVHPMIRSSILTLKYVDMEPLHVNLAEVIALQKPIAAQVWSVPVPVYDCGYEASEWLARVLKKPDSFRLVYYASEQSRNLRGRTSHFYKLNKNDTGAFPDELAFNLINEASVEDLNTRLVDAKASHRNFRPNFVLRGAKAYEEDNWKFIKIGENVFEIIKPCTRCILTTIDPETGVRNTKSEPLETLKSYRQIVDPVERESAGTSPRMGLQIALRSSSGGVVSRRDPIYVA